MEEGEVGEEGEEVQVEAAHQGVCELGGVVVVVGDGDGGCGRARQPHLTACQILGHDLQLVGGGGQGLGGRGRGGGSYLSEGIFCVTMATQVKK